MTIFDALTVKLGRTPTNAEVKADVQRILREARIARIVPRLSYRPVRHGVIEDAMREMGLDGFDLEDIGDK